MFREICCEFGIVLKTHGVKGEILVKTAFNIPAKFKIPGSIFFEIEGLLVPFFIEEYTLHNEETVQLKLFDINNKNLAQRFIDSKVFIEEFVFNSKKQAAPATVVGYELFDQDECSIGKITGMMDIPGNFLLTVQFNEQEILVPFNEHVLIDIDKKKKKVVLNIPPGLKELNQ